MYHDEGIATLIGGLFAAAFAVVSMYAIVAVSALAISNVFESSDHPSAKDVASTAYGLESGKSYPFVYGHQIQGSIGEASARGGLFSSSASVSLTPGSAIALSFERGDQSSIVELPLRKVTFIKKKDVKPSIRVFIKAGQHAHPLDYKEKTRFYGVPWLVRSNVPLAQNNWFKDLKRKNQLGVFLSDYLDSAKVMLSPQLYQRLLDGR